MWLTYHWQLLFDFLLSFFAWSSHLHHAVFCVCLCNDKMCCLVLGQSPAVVKVAACDSLTLQPVSYLSSDWLVVFFFFFSRYESTITGQFFGHTHLDEFQMFYDEATMTRPLGVAFIAPSVTTYVNLNPGEFINQLSI